MAGASFQGHKERNKGRPLLLKKKASIALVYRKATESAAKLADSLTEYLIDQGCRVFTAPEQKPIRKAPLLKSSQALKKMDLILVLGGDGTYLRASKLLDLAAVPILGINMGSLGFLTPTKAEEAFAMVDKALTGKLEMYPRTMLEIYWGEAGKKSKNKIIALNDIVIERGRLSQLIVVEVKCGNEFVSEIKADGLIVSSPTGSTAYNLAAGGPLLHPFVRGFSVTPIAPHSLTSRPLVVPDDEVLSLKVSIPKIPGKSKSAVPTAQLIVDGQLITDLIDREEITVSLNKSHHWMVQDPNRSFFKVLRDKLKFGDRA